MAFQLHVHTIFPLVSVSTRRKIFWLDRCRRCTHFGPFDSSPNGYMMVTCTDLSVADHSRSVQGQVHCMTTEVKNNEFCVRWLHPS
jgi:hypothetical protein